MSLARQIKYHADMKPTAAVDATGASVVKLMPFGRKWSGPRGPHLSGVDKQVARHQWDLQRFA